MADIKWIKIVVDIFDDEKIQLIEALPSADTIIVIWFKILCLAGKSNSGGLLIMSDRIPYTDEMLSAIFRRKVTDVRMALDVFEKYGMIEIIENTYAIPNWRKHQSLDYYEKKKEYDREYHRLKRAEQKAILIDKNSAKEESRIDVVRQSDDLSNSNSYSYSFNNNSNLNNLIYLLNNNLYKDSNYITSNTILRDALNQWMEYKDGRTPKKNNHFTEQGMRSFLTVAIKYHRLYGDEAIADVVQYTISNQWQGVVWDWLEKHYKKLDRAAKDTTKTEKNFDRPERWRTCPDNTWEKLKPYAHDDGSFDWVNFNPENLNMDDKAWMRKNGM